MVCFAKSFKTSNCGLILNVYHDGEKGFPLASVADINVFSLSENANLLKERSLLSSAKRSILNLDVDLK